MVIFLGGFTLLLALKSASDCSSIAQIPSILHLVELGAEKKTEYAGTSIFRALPDGHNYFRVQSARVREMNQFLV